MGFCPMHDFCWNLPSLCFICAIKHSIVCGALMPRTGSIWLGYTNWKASGINPKYLALNRTIGNRQIHRPSADGSVYIRPMDRHRPMGKKFTIVWTLLLSKIMELPTTTLQEPRNHYASLQRFSQRINEHKVWYEVNDNAVINCNSPDSTARTFART